MLVEECREDRLAVRFTGVTVEFVNAVRRACLQLRGLQVTKIPRGWISTRTNLRPRRLRDLHLNLKQLVLHSHGSASLPIAILLDAGCPDTLPFGAGDRIEVGDDTIKRISDGQCFPLKVERFGDVMPTGTCEVASCTPQHLELRGGATLAMPRQRRVVTARDLRLADGTRPSKALGLPPSSRDLPLLVLDAGERVCLHAAVDIARADSPPICSFRWHAVEAPTPTFHVELESAGHLPAVAIMDEALASLGREYAQLQEVARQCTTQPSIPLVSCHCGASAEQIFLVHPCEHTCLVCASCAQELDRCPTCASVVCLAERQAP